MQDAKFQVEGQTTARLEDMRRMHAEVMQYILRISQGDKITL